MAKSVESKQLLYAHTSAHTSQDCDVAGIGVVIKAPRRHTLHKHSGTKETADPVVAAYEAIASALREARHMGARAVVVHTDCEPVVWQIEKRVPVSPGQLARHLETRSLLNQFNRAQISLVAPAENQPARRLAQRAFEHGCRGHQAPEEQLSLPLMSTGTV